MFGLDGVGDHLLVEQARERAGDGDEVHVDEHAARLEQLEQLGEQRALALGREVVDGADRGAPRRS